MLQRVLGRLAWALVVGAVLNGMAGLCLAALRAYGVIGGSWPLVLSPIWVPSAIAGVLLALILLEIAWTRCRDLMETAFRAPAVWLLERHS